MERTIRPGPATPRIPAPAARDDEFGYRRFRSAAMLQAALGRLYDEEIVPAVREGVAALVYTPLSDVEDETNGLITYDRRVVKVDEQAMRAVNDRLRAAAEGRG